MIKNGEIADALDIEKIIVSNLQSINQNTIVSANATVTDKSYTYASSDTFSDSNGYNNTIDTENSTGTYDSEDTNSYKATRTDAFVDEMDDNTIDLEKWSISLSGGGTNSVTEVNNDYQQIIQSTCASSTFNHTTTCTSIGLSLNTGDSVEISVKVLQAACSSYLEGNYNPVGTAIIKCGGATVKSLIRQASVNGAGTTSWDNKIVRIQKTSETTANVYVDEVFSHELTGMSGSELQFYTNACNGVYASGSPSASGTIQIRYVRYYTYASGIVQTNSKAFSSNVKSIFIDANKVLNGDSTITVDVSSDGGSTWDVTEQALDNIIELDGDDNDIVIKFNLNVDGNNTPELYGYSYQVFT